MSYIVLFNRFVSHLSREPFPREPSSRERSLEGRTDEDLRCWFSDASSYIDAFLEIQPAAKSSSVTRALLLGGLAYSLGSQGMSAAFYAGYQLAIKQLFGNRLANSSGFDDRLFSYCVTESGGNGPKQIAATLQQKETGDWVLNGVKTFVTAPDIATDYLVVASAGWMDGQNQLRIVHLNRPTNNASIKLNVFPALPFLSTIRHGSLTFNEHIVHESQILSGDAYTRYVKPFRWCEDLHVFSAVFGLLSRAAFQGGNSGLLAQLMVLSSSINSLSTDPSEHDILLFSGLQSIFAGLDEQVAALLREESQALGDMWQRDRKLFDVAKGARIKRAEIAWDQFQAI